MQLAKTQASACKQEAELAVVSPVPQVIERETTEVQKTLWVKQKSDFSAAEKAVANQMTLEETCNKDLATLQGLADNAQQARAKLLPEGSHIPCDENHDHSACLDCNRF